VVKAYVVMSPEYVSVQKGLSKNASSFDQKVISRFTSSMSRGLLAPYEYPKEVEFIDQLPMTTTGKVQRRFLRLEEERRAALAYASCEFDNSSF
jgi:acetyl-CoA synthetase